MRSASKITITDAARRAFPDLAKMTAPSIELWKDHLLGQCDPISLEWMAPDARQFIDVSPEHYAPLGLQIIVYRDQGLHVRVDKAGSFKGGTFRPDN
jgi:hypothetical protein